MASGTVEADHFPASAFAEDLTHESFVNAFRHVEVG